MAAEYLEVVGTGSDSEAAEQMLSARPPPNNPADWPDPAEWGYRDVNAEGIAVWVGPKRKEHTALLRDAVAARASGSVDADPDADRRRVNARHHAIEHDTPAPILGPSNSAITSLQDATLSVQKLKQEPSRGRCGVDRVEVGYSRMCSRYNMMLL